MLVTIKAPTVCSGRDIAILTELQDYQVLGSGPRKLTPSKRLPKSEGCSQRLIPLPFGSLPLIYSSPTLLQNRGAPLTST